MIDVRRFEAHGGIVRTGQIVIGVVFLIAALAKVGDLKTFAGQVHNFRVVPIALENGVALVLPWVELVAGLALVLGIGARSGALVATALMAVFTLAVVAALARNLDIECGCFGKADATRVGASKLAQNVLLLLLGLVGSMPRRLKAPQGT